MELGEIVAMPVVWVPILVWTVFIKGVALWRAAKRRDIGWFVAILIVNTAGILELIYVLKIRREKIARHGVIDKSRAVDKSTVKIFIAADHNGFEMKSKLTEWLRAEGYETTDLGPETYDKDDDYPDYGLKVAEEVTKDTKNNYGILLCGSGIGMNVIADKVKGIRAATIHDPEIARAAQRDDDINVLALGAHYITLAEAKRVVRAWLTTPFSEEERHSRRIAKIHGYEHNREKR